MLRPYVRFILRDRQAILEKEYFYMIGIFDSGVGGLTVLRELLSLLPGQDYVYLGDTARTPYGTKGQETIVRYSLECAEFLLGKEIEVLVVACNTASSYALDALREKYKIPVIGTIESASKLAIAQSKNKSIGVIGTEATIKSEAYQKAINSFSPGTKVRGKACPLFVPLVEQGMFEGEIVEKTIELYLSEFRSEEIDTLILGCTHYPMLKAAIESYLGNSIEIVECSKSIAEQVKSLFAGKDGDIPNKNARQIYCVTDGVEQFNKLSRLFLNNGQVEAIKVGLKEIK
jgi:glutamate racemase